MIDFSQHLYAEKAKLLQPWTHWRFLKPRMDATSSQLVEIVDTNITGKPETDNIKLMDIKPYKKGEQRQFTEVPAAVFLDLIAGNKVEQFTPKA